jgi:hypothetical protein
MDYKKVRQIEDRIAKYRLKLSDEKDNKKREILRLKISIDEYRVKLERLK